MVRLISQADIFGQPVKLKYRGADRYTTVRGGLITLASYICVLLLSIELLQRFVTRANPDVTTFERRSLKNEHFNIWDNRLFVRVSVFDVLSKKGVQLDARAGRLLANKSQVANLTQPVSTESLEFGNCENLEETLDTFQVLNRQALLTHIDPNIYCLKNERQITIDGTVTSGDLSFLQFMIVDCDKTTLPAGQDCMGSDEKARYYSSKQLLVQYLDTMLDFENIEQPFQTQVDFSLIPVDLEKPQAYDLTLKSHNFKDDLKLLQLRESVDSKTTFFSIDAEKQVSVNFLNKRTDVLAGFLIRLGEISVVDQRRVYSFLELLGDLGGVFSSIYAVGSFVHSILVANQESFQLLSSFFKVDDEEARQGQVTSAQPQDLKARLDLNQPFKAGLMVRLAQQTILQGLVDLLPRCCCSLRQRRAARFKAKAQERIDTSLDLRTLILSQELLKTVTSVLFDAKYRPLLRLQRRHKVISLKKHDSDRDSLLDLSDSDAKAELVEQIGAGSEEQLSPRGEKLRSGLFSQSKRRTPMRNVAGYRSSQDTVQVEELQIISDLDQTVSVQGDSRHGSNRESQVMSATVVKDRRKRRISEQL